MAEVELPSDHRADTRKLTNGFARNMHEAMVLLDMYMSDERQSPAAFMHSPTAEDDYGPNDSAVRQDTWLREHARDYEFDVLDPDEIDEPKVRLH